MRMGNQSRESNLQRRVVYRQKESWHCGSRRGTGPCLDRHVLIVVKLTTNEGKDPFGNGGRGKKKKP